MKHNELLGKWIFYVLKNHFYHQKNENADKLFIKVNGLTHDNVKAVLSEIRNNSALLKNYYDPIIRTIKPVEGYPEYSFQGTETSTKLRNYTQVNQALLMIINENTPEGQSLENIFAIDESYLLSEKGFQSLFTVLSDEYNMAGEEIETIQLFLNMYRKLTDPQLRFILRFISEVISSNSPSIVQLIQDSLPELNLFKDNELMIPKGEKKLKANFLLANLQKSNGDLDPEKLQDNLYKFLNKEEQNNFPSDLWQQTNPEQFEQEALNFINQKSLELLEYQFKDIQSLFSFKDKTTLYDQIRNHLSLEEYTKEEKQHAEDGIASIEKGDDPDEMQHFLEEHEGELSQKPDLVKKITRKIEKARHPEDYKDLNEAILYYSFTLIEDNIEELDEYNTTFELTVVNNKLNEETKKLVTIYLENLESVAPLFKFDSESLNDAEVDTSISDTEVTFNLKLKVGDQYLGKENFKLIGFENLELLSILDLVQEGSLPYMKIYDDEQVETLDVGALVQEEVSAYLSLNEEGFNEHYDSFVSFQKYFIEALSSVTEKGLFGIDFYELEANLETLLKGVTTNATITNTIYKYLNYIGSIDNLPVKLGQRGYSKERILTVINPIRLVSLKHRYQEINHKVENWINNARKDNLDVTKLEDYMNHVVDETIDLGPRYFTSDGDDSFLIEVSETLGEGHFVLNTERSDKMDHLANDLSKELLTSVKNYFEVYPFAKDGMDILFLYCQSADVITKSIDELFKKVKNLNKLKITVHSTHAAPIHRRLNQWVKQREEYIHPDGTSKFPKVEIKVISGLDVNEISKQINNHMIDADLVVLADYFAQSSQIKYEFDKINYEKSDNWFEVVYKEPLLNTEVVKRMSYVSESMPPILKSFYQLQYISQKKEILEEDEVYVLKNKVALSNQNNDLIDFLHSNFNWIMFMDRYLDKSLLEQTSTNAQIIQYKSKAGSNNNYKLIVSSSEYIRKLNNQQEDEYYDRLGKKLSLILKNPQIDRKKVVDSIQEVKKISGALVLKAIGPGKYSHEMVATYLSKKFRENANDNVLQVWSVCDELPWFSNNKRRPDLAITTIKEVDGTLQVDFNIVELKFVSYSIFERERYDAIKQVDAGMNVYENLFSFDENKTDSEFWREELVHYFIERGSYSPEEAHILKALQHTPISNINVNINSSIDVYCYTSNLHEHDFESISNGAYYQKLEGEYDNYVFSRSYILNHLGASEEIAPDYAEIESNDETFEKELEARETISSANDNGKDATDNEPEEGEQETEAGSENEGEDTDIPTSDLGDSKSEIEHEPTSIPTVKPDKEDADQEGSNLVNGENPEVVALKDMEPNENVNEDQSDLKKQYINNLETHFNRNKLNVKVKNAVVGSSVVRLILDIPSSLNSDKVMRRRQDIQLWLGLDQEPHMFIDKNGINIDIARDNPDTIFFEDFMKISREQLSDDIKDTNLISPLGFDPLNNVINIDFSDPSTPHLLTGGTTGSGKSVTLNSIILGSMCLYDPSKLQFVFIDPKQVEFTVYKGLPHTRDVVTDINEAVSTLDILVQEMEERYKLFAQEFVSNLDEYVELTGKRLPRIVIVFDEFADFMSQDKEIAQKVENAILKLGQKARAAGLHLIICTQNPKSDIINTNIRNNLGARLALRATDSTASTVILGDSGAENLGGKGDFLAKTSSQKVTRGKSPFLTPKVKRALLKYFSGKK
ncbi:hypothetical protein N783_00200 [Pontibacillus marinus BH030004 = DSM 16465]|uniref:FtsK domain-containing protein n=1 Tax=Pontibacillus marinus BH030004 = DSM 16465 TaxID=1385511 RepID=A0A0A5GF67_9BACI|nr:hypothetical protein N783_00200 [Pontibacillus marinus BH030004 = DSM 16465]